MAKLWHRKLMRVIGLICLIVLLAACVRNSDGTFDVTVDQTMSEHYGVSQGTYLYDPKTQSFTPKSAAVAPRTVATNATAVTASGTPAAVQTPVVVVPFAPGTLPPLNERVVVSDDPTKWYRLVLMNDGRFWQDGVPAEETGERPGYTLAFTVPITLPGGMVRDFKGVRSTLLKVGDPTPLAHKSNGMSVTLEPGGKYMVRTEPGNNNSFALELARTVDKTPVAGKPLVISDHEDWRRVVYEPDGRVWMDNFYEGSPSFEVSFTLPLSFSPPQRVWQGNAATLIDAETGTIVSGLGPDNKLYQASYTQNISVELKPGGKYVVRGGKTNGGFALEMPRGGVSLMSQPTATARPAATTTPVPAKPAAAPAKPTAVMPTPVEKP